jgi:quercetin dioxygenase-like cupin family protein
MWLKLTQETVDKRGVFIVNAASVPIENLEKKGAERVKVRYLVDERQGSERFALRLYSVEKSGQTPLDRHEYEHQVYVLAGQGFLRQSEDIALQTLHTGDVVFIPSNAVHQFVNEREEPFVFLCVKGSQVLYPSGEKSTVSNDSTQNFC